MQGRIGFLLIPFLCSICNIIPQTRFVNPDFPISQFLHIFSTLPYIPSVSGVLCGSDCAVQQSQSSHNDHRAHSQLSSIPCPCRADGAYCRSLFLPGFCSQHLSTVTRPAVHRQRLPLCMESESSCRCPFRAVQSLSFLLH